MDTENNDLDRILFYKHACKVAEAIYIQNPLDAENLTTWGGMLLGLSQYQTIQDSKSMIRDAISKLDEALIINPKIPEAFWCLGNAHTSNALLTPNEDEAKDSFDKAEYFYKKAVDEDPNNKLYRSSLEVCKKALGLRQEIHNQITSQEKLAQAMGGGRGAPSNTTSSSQAHELPFSLFAISKSQVDPPAPR